MRRAAPLALVVVAAALAAAGCGTSVDGNGSTGAAGVGTVPTPSPTLTARPDGRVDVDGDTQGSLSLPVAELLRGGDAPLDVEVGGSGARTAFGELCDGTIDAVDSTRPISARELTACRRNSLHPVSFVVAADAVVVATRNDSDVGVDCLTVRQVRDLFRAGTSVRNWKQVHGYDLPLRVTGPSPASDAYGVFAAEVLGDPLDGLGALRHDYAGHATDREIRATVVGSARSRANAPLRAKAQHDLAALEKAISDKQRAVTAALAQVRKGRRDGRAAVDRARDDAGLAEARTQLNALRRSLAPARAYAARTGVAERELEAGRGWAGAFRFAYYELFEEQLRPIEVTRGDDPRFDCVFPSADTVATGAFPLSRQLRITVTREGLKRAEVRRMLDATLANAQRLAAEANLVPLSNDRVAQQRAQVAGKTPIADAEAGR
jgi:ABC-type phosphate transport system substrate-binding protein